MSENIFEPENEQGQFDRPKKPSGEHSNPGGSGGEPIISRPTAPETSGNAAPGLVETVRPEDGQGGEGGQSDRVRAESAPAMPTWLEGITAKEPELKIPVPVKSEKTPTVDKEQIARIGQLLEMASEEIRTPLQSIVGFLELLVQGRVSDAKQAMKFLGIAYRQAQALTNRVKDVEIASQIFTGKLKLQPTVLAFDQIIPQAIEACASVSKERKIIFNLQSVADIPTFQADGVLLEHALANTMALALERMTGDLHIRAEAVKKDLLVHMIGGDSLQKFNSGATVRSEGLGALEHEVLGFFVAEKIIGAHGGNISIQRDTKAIHGFTLTLPIEPEVIGKGTILITEDNPHAALLLEYALEQEGYHILKATNGLEALQIMEEKHIDLLILDVMLPGLDGFEVAHRLRTSPDTISLPIIMASAKARDEDRAAALRVGADAYFTKPLGITDLVGAVENLLANGRDIPTRGTHGSTNHGE